jgi:hypothetical protein
MACATQERNWVLPAPKAPQTAIGSRNLPVAVVTEGEFQFVSEGGCSFEKSCQIPGSKTARISLNASSPQPRIAGGKTM